MPFEGGFTPAVEPGLIGDDFNKYPVAHARVADVGFNTFDFHECCAEDFL